MLPSVSVPSTDDVETACTLVQIGDNVTPYMQDDATLQIPSFKGLEVSNSDDAMDKIVGRLDVCCFAPMNSINAMDQVIKTDETLNINVETKTKLLPNTRVNVETKRYTVKLIRLDSILFDDIPVSDADVSEDKTTEANNTVTGPFTHSKVQPKENRITKRPRSASKNVEYAEEPKENLVIIKNKSGYVRNIKPSASGPSEEQVRAQTKCSEQPSSCLPGLPIPEVNPYDGETEPDTDVSVEPTDKSTSDGMESTPRKGSIIIMIHNLKKKTTS